MTTEKTETGRLVTRIHPDRAAAGAEAAALVGGGIRQAIAERGTARVVFACAPSQNEFLAALVAETIDWPRVTVFHMDEYAGLGAGHPASFQTYLREHLLQELAAPPRQVHLIRSEGDLDAECVRYGALLGEAPLDWVCLGIGENGHLAFNDPPIADLHDPESIKSVSLDEACRRQQVNDGCFPELGDVPQRALTLTIPTLLSAGALSGVILGERKAQAVQAALTGPIHSGCPASFLRLHPHVTLHLDPAAAALLPK